MIYTNKVDLALDRTAIARDFVILQAHRDSGDYKRTRVPDAALQYGHVLSVAYERGNDCYILYRRSQADQDGLRRCLQACDAQTILREVDITADDPKLKDRTLAQLLFNAVPQLGSLEGFHNLSGRLYFRRPDWVKPKKGPHSELWVLELSLDRKNCIQLWVRTFRRVNEPFNGASGPLYVIDSQNRQLRRLLKEDPDKDTELYELGTTYHNKRNNVDFLDFSSADAFDNSKAGVLRRFLRSAERMLKKYLRMSLVQMNECEHLGVDPKKREVKQVLDLLKDQKVYLVDLVCEETSVRLTERLRQELAQFREITLLDGTPEPGSVVLQIIHNKAYFETHDEEDHYNQVPNDCVVQHLTVEDFQPDNLDDKDEETPLKKEDACIKKALLELAIKLDIRQKQVNCFPWQSMDFSKPVAFVTAHKDQNDGVIHYQRLIVSPTGELTFDRWESGLSLYDDPVKENIEAAFLNYDQDFDKNVEGVIYDDPEQMQIIRRTGQITLPDLDALHTVIRDNVPEDILEVPPLLELLKEKHRCAVQDNRKADAKKYLTMLNSLPVLGNSASRREIKKFTGTNGKLSTNLSRCYHAVTGKWIFRSVKGKQAAEEFFSGIMDIRCFRERNCAFYYAGFLINGIHQKLAKGCVIRRVSSTGGEVQIEKYLPLMEVGFVRAATWTVLPFPFKYLREWEKTSECGVLRVAGASQL